MRHWRTFNICQSKNIFYNPTQIMTDFSCFLWLRTLKDSYDFISLYHPPPTHMVVLLHVIFINVLNDSITTHCGHHCLQKLSALVSNATTLWLYLLLWQRCRNHSSKEYISDLKSIRTNFSKRKSFILYSKHQ